MTSISSNSLSYSLLQQTQSDQKSLFQKADMNKSGGLSLEEFTASAPTHETDTSKIETLFTSLDSDSDGNLTESELESGLAQQKPPAPNLLSSDMLSEFFTATDQDGDGALTEEEFVTALENNKASAPPPPPAPPLQGGRGGTAPQEESSGASQIYDSLDTNKDGTVSLDELMAASESEEDDEESSSLSSSDSDALTRQFTQFLLSAQESYLSA
jgi:Ca2+-binding EF-hand superfamily protein